jgi:hypothetical protein
MKPERYAASLCLMLVSVALLSCATGPLSRQPASPQAGPAGVPASIEATYAGLKASGGRVYAIAPEASDVRIFVFRGGRATHLGHNHVLAAPRFIGRVFLPEDGAVHARFDLLFRLDQLQIDPPGLIGTIGDHFASVLSADDLAGVRAHMLGDSNMQADKYPIVRIHSLQIIGEAPAYVARIEIELHGQQRELWVPLQVHVSPERISVSGALVLRQTEFGVEPYSILGGLLAVQDPVLIEFRLEGFAKT